ncbi:hypothetical protein KKB55_13015, partial [Myxococcota bacterium]|nr:hypothetical protein [Myxococcota bacterium]
MRRITLALLLGLLRPALGQDAGDTRRLLSPLSPSRYLGIEDADGLARGVVAASATAIYEARPLIFAYEGRKTADIIEGRLLTDLTLAYGLHKRLTLGARLPILAAQAGRAVEGGPLPRAALLDPALGLKLALLETRRGLGLSLIGALSQPIEGGESYAAEPGYAFTGGISAALRLHARLDALIHLGYLARGVTHVDHLRLGDELRAGLGLSWRPALGWALSGELRGAGAAADLLGPVESRPIDGDLALRR